MISFWSYKREYKKINKKILSEIDKVLLKGNIFFGTELRRFEKSFLSKYNSCNTFNVFFGFFCKIINRHCFTTKIDNPFMFN